jgi:predicted dehydrogenase
MRLRTGIIGVGKHGQRYAQHAAEDLDELELVAVARRDEARGRAVAERFRCEFTSDVLSLADRRDLDLLIVAAAPALIESVVPLAAARGTRLLIEKPVALDLASGRQISAALARAGVYCMAGQTLRLNTVVQSLVAHIGELGRIDSMSFSQRFPPQLELAWLDDPNQSGGGNVLHTGVHCFDLCRLLSGRDPTTVTCTGRSVYTQRTEDVFTACLAFDGGPEAIVGCSRTTRSRNGLVEITGEHGQLVGDHVHTTLYRIDEKGRTSIELGPPRHTVLEMLRLLVEDCRLDRAPSIPYGTGLAAVAIADACYRSMRSGLNERVVMPPAGP